ncbi:hypothetical protein ACFLZV_06745 [Candidatus Margulisiibacteriota bacterium]
MLKKLLPITDQISVTEQVLNGAWGPKSAIGLIPTELFIAYIIPLLLKGKDNVFDIVGLLFANKYLFSELIKLIEPKYSVKRELFKKSLDKEIGEIRWILNIAKGLKLSLRRIGDFDLIKRKIGVDANKISELDINCNEEIVGAFKNTVSILENNNNLKKVRIFNFVTDSEIIFSIDSRSIGLDFTGFHTLFPTKDGKEKTKLQQICEIIVNNKMRKKKIYFRSISIKDFKFKDCFDFLKSFGAQIEINKIRGNNDDDDEYDDSETRFNISNIKEFLKEFEDGKSGVSGMSFEIDCLDMAMTLNKGKVQKLMLHSSGSNYENNLKAVWGICSNIDFRIYLPDEDEQEHKIIKTLEKYREILTSIELIDYDDSSISSNRLRLPGSYFYKTLVPKFTKINKGFANLKRFRFHNSIELIIYPKKKVNEVDLRLGSYWPLLFEALHSSGLSIREIEGSYDFIDDSISFENHTELCAILKQFKDLRRIGPCLVPEEDNIWDYINKLKTRGSHDIVLDINGWIYEIRKRNLSIEIDLDRYLDVIGLLPKRIVDKFSDPMQRLHELSNSRLSRGVEKVKIDFPKLVIANKWLISNKPGGKQKKNSIISGENPNKNYSDMLNYLKPFTFIKEAKLAIHPEFVESFEFRRSFLSPFVEDHPCLEKITIIPKAYKLRENRAPDMIIKDDKYQCVKENKSVTLGLYKGRFSYIELSINKRPVSRYLLTPFSIENIHAKLYELFGLEKDLFKRMGRNAQKK